jgi:hypothetical protein
MYVISPISDSVTQGLKPVFYMTWGIHVLIKTPDLIIEDIEVFINTVPNEDCRKLEHSMDAVIGLSVSRGFTEKVKALAGGKAGCTHLVHLLTTMAPAILQGYWALTARRTPRTDEDAKRAQFLPRNSSKTLVTHGVKMAMFIGSFLISPDWSPGGILDDPVLKVSFGQ